MSQDEMLAALLQEVLQLRAEVNALHDAQQFKTCSTSDVVLDTENVASDTATKPLIADAGTSRRGLLRGAAASATAAAVAAFAVGGVEHAQAASNVTGDTVIAGQTTTAGATTTLINTGGTLPTPTLEVDNTATGAYALRAKSVGGVAVTGYDPSAGGVGVQGIGDNASGVGVIGTSAYGIGVMCESSNNVDLAVAGRIWQWPRTVVGAPTSGTYHKGESIRDYNGDLWLCIDGDGTTLGSWARVLHLAPGAVGGGVITYLSKPIRLLDTRLGATDAHQTPGTPCTSSLPFTVNIAGVIYNSVTVPSSVAGAIGNVTVVAGSSSNSFLEVVPSGAGFTGAANLAFGPNQVVSNAFNVGLLSGNLDIIIGAGSVDVIVDLFAIVA